MGGGCCPTGGDTLNRYFVFRPLVCMVGQDLFLKRLSFPSGIFPPLEPRVKRLGLGTGLRQSRSLTRRLS